MCSFNNFNIHAAALRYTEARNAHASLRSSPARVSSSLKHSNSWSFPTVLRIQYRNTATACVYFNMAFVYCASAKSAFPSAFAAAANSIFSFTDLDARTFAYSSLASCAMVFLTNSAVDSHARRLSFIWRCFTSPACFMSSSKSMFTTSLAFASSSSSSGVSRSGGTVWEKGVRRLVATVSGNRRG